jgi:hypothetical protein
MKRTTTSPFDHQPDRELGHALRDVLTTGDEAAFIGRVLAATPWPTPRADAEWWDVLGGWARQGMAAAAVLIGIGAFMLGRAIQSADTGILDEPLVTSDSTPAFFASSTPPDVDIVLGNALRR